MTYLPVDHEAACLVGRIWRADVGGPALVALRGETLVDITSSEVPTMRDLLERPDAAAHVRTAPGEALGPLAPIMAQSKPGAGADTSHMLSPADLQAIKACGVTFANSMLERVIEEQASGDPSRAAGIRERCTAIIGTSLRDLTPGSDAAMALKAALIEEGLWSQYLEVGIGPDAEVFSKAQPMSSVGWGAAVGLHPISTWNNPEPEVVLAVNSRAQVKGVTLGNDVNLRDVEGRSALLLGKAKDNNASAALGPFVRLFDDGFGMQDVRAAMLELTVTGQDGFVLNGQSSMAEISRDPLDLVAQTCGTHHQYPDGFFLYLGTLFAPTQDRDTPGEGFTHKVGDEVRIAWDRLGALVNTVRLSPDCPPWQFGTADLMRNLARRQLL